ncbi:hypothetical protein JTB14_016445 [Gonioctena quinquepunctata]|nr:hypothetical protein JTB14_016445 [Gonioctena quinquepunctata]
MIIFPRKNMEQELMMGAPAGSIHDCHEFVKPSASDPVLANLDGHYRHTRNIELIDLAKQNHVNIICLPPNSTHKMQPPNVGFMLPLKTYHAQEVGNWLRENQLSTVSPHVVAELFDKAHIRATTMEVSSKAFKKTGLVPFAITLEITILEFIHPHHNTTINRKSNSSTRSNVSAKPE